MVETEDHWLLLFPILLALKVFSDGPPAAARADQQ